MSIDIQNEELVRLSDVPKLKFMPPSKSGKRTHIATLYRWALGGTGGVRLETLKVGGCVCTSVEALQRFFDALTVVRNGEGVIASYPVRGNPIPNPPAWASARRRRQIEAVDRELDKIFGDRPRRKEPVTDHPDARTPQE